MLQKILVITRNFPPMVGGMERLIYESTNALQRSFEVRVVGPTGCQSYLPDSTQAYSCTPNPLYRFLVSSFLQTIKTATSWRPDLIFCGSGLMALTGLMAARLCGAKLIIYAHGLDLTAPHPVYQKLFLPAICKADHIIVNSRYTAELAHAKRISNRKTTVINPGVTLIKPDETSGKKFREKYALGQGPILLSVGRLTPRKGLAEFIRHCMPGVINANPASQLLIIGGQPANALHGGSAYQQIITEINKLPKNSVRLLGKAGDSDLAAAYNAATVFVFPILDIPGDVEGFGMAALEAAAHGTPSIAFASGGVPDAIKHMQSGLLIEPGNYPELTNAAIEMVRGAHPTLASGARAHAQRHSWQEFGKQLNACVSDQFPTGS